MKMTFLNLLLLIAITYGCSKDDSEPIDNLPNLSKSYNIVDTGVEDFYNNSTIISTPIHGNDFYGQDATYSGNLPSYTDNGDGTITDEITGLIWEQDMGTKISYDAAFSKAENSTLGGHTDWRRLRTNEW